MKLTQFTWCSIITATFAFLGWANIESYCFFYPGIDTYYAPGYSEDAFSQVTPGMTTHAVEQLLGRPLHAYSDVDGSTTWAYTEDGKSWYFDFAWLSREIYFRDGRVVEVAATVYHN